MDALRCLAVEALLRHAAKRVADLDPEALKLRNFLQRIYDNVQTFGPGSPESEPNP